MAGDLNIAFVSNLNLLEGEMNAEFFSSAPSSRIADFAALIESTISCHDAQVVESYHVVPGEPTFLVQNIVESDICGPNETDIMTMTSFGIIYCQIDNYNLLQPSSICIDFWYFKFVYGCLSAELVDIMSESEAKLWFSSSSAGIAEAEKT